MNNASDDGEVSIENSTEGIKLWLSRRDSLIIQKNAYYKQILETFSPYPSSEPSLGVSCIWSDFSSTNAKLLIETLKEEIKSVLSKKY